MYFQINFNYNIIASFPTFLVSLETPSYAFPLKLSVPSLSDWEPILLDYYNDENNLLSPFLLFMWLLVQCWPFGFYNQFGLRCQPWEGLCLPVSAINSLKVLFGLCFYLIGVELYNNTSLFSLQALVAILPWTSPTFSPFLWFIASLNLFSIVTYTLACTHAHPFYMYIYRQIHTHNLQNSVLLFVYVWFQDWLCCIKLLIRRLLLEWLVRVVQVL